MTLFVPTLHCGFNLEMALNRQMKLPRTIFTVGTIRGGGVRFFTVVVVVADVVVVVGAVDVVVEVGVVVVVDVVVVDVVDVVGVRCFFMYGLNFTGR